MSPPHVHRPCSKSACGRSPRECLPVILELFTSPIATLAAGLWLAVLVLSSAASSHAQVMVIVPHPDDDVIMAAGVVARAAARGESAHVVYLTNGDIFGMEAGLLRQDEAVAAQSVLGLSEDQLIFLGYPDAAMEDIYYSYPSSSDVRTGPSGLSSTYGARGLGGMAYHRYAFGSDALYNAHNVRQDLRSLFATFRPAHIFFTHQSETHGDHRALARFATETLESVVDADPSYAPTVHQGIVWLDGWPTGSSVTDYFTAPNLSGTELTWAARESLDVPLALQTSDMSQNLKYLAIAEHQSQGGNDGYIGLFVRKDEVFWTYRPQGADRPPVPDAGSDQTVPAGALVQLDGSQSFDPDGTTPTYAWRQVAGPAVTLSSAASARPNFTVPAGIADNTQLSFELAVSDAVGSSVPDAVNVTVVEGTSPPPPPPPPSGNLALAATATASSQSASTSQTAAKAIDGSPLGYPNDWTREWATLGQGAGAWLQLSWASAQTLSQVVLFDRPNGNDHVTAGTLSFSDGTSVAVGTLDNAGASVTVSFPARSATWVRFTVSAVSPSTANIGLAELEAYGSASPEPNLPPVAVAGANQTVAQGATVRLRGDASYDPEGAPLSYRWTQTLGTPVLTIDNVANPTFVAPSGSTTAETLTFQLTVSDGVSSSASSTASVVVQPPGSPPPPPPPAENLALAATATASSQNASTSQTAAKAIDGSALGYPNDWTREWATLGQGAGAWLQLSWTSAQTLSQVVLFDRPNGNDHVTAGTLSFSDGTSVAVGALDNAGAPVTVSFPARSATWVRFAVGEVSASTANIGLAELEAYDR